MQYREYYALKSIRSKFSGFIKGCSDGVEHLSGKKMTKTTPSHLKTKTSFIIQWKMVENGLKAFVCETHLVVFGFSLQCVSDHKWIEKQ